MLYFGVEAAQTSVKKVVIMNNRQEVVNHWTVASVGSSRAEMYFC